VVGHIRRNTICALFVDHLTKRLLHQDTNLSRTPPDLPATVRDRPRVRIGAQYGAFRGLLRTRRGALRGQRATAALRALRCFRSATTQMPRWRAPSQSPSVAPTMTLSEPAPQLGSGARLLDDVLCGVDGSRHAYEAVRQAAELAGPGGHLTLLAVSGVRGEGRHRTATLAPVRAQRALDRAERSAVEAGVAADCEIDERSPVADVLLERARGHGVLAIGPPSMSRVAHLLVGGTATIAAHVLPASVLVARRAPNGTRFPDRILVASDALDRSDELVDFAIGLAGEHDASLTLLHAIQGEQSHHPTRVAAQVERVTRSLGDQAAVRIAPSRARALIVETAAAERCSLIVLSSRRVGGLRALGSVSERVVHEAPCSVLVVRPEDLQRAGAAAPAATVDGNEQPGSG